LCHPAKGPEFCVTEGLEAASLIEDNRGAAGNAGFPGGIDCRDLSSAVSID
jgi:hypothetical protein